LHQRTKFHKDRSNRYGEIAIFVIFQYGGRRHFGFSKIRNFNDRSAVGGEYVSLYQILSKSVKRLQRYSDLTVFSKWGPSAAYSCRKNWGFRGISPPKWGAMATKPPKRTSLRESASFEPSSVKIHRRV